MSSATSYSQTSDSKSQRYNKKSKLIWTPVDSVERRSNLSYEEFVREYASAGKPVIITDPMKNWKALTKWNMDFFKSQYGSSEAFVMDYKAGTSMRDRTLDRTYVKMSIADFIDVMTSHACDKLLYLSEFHIGDHPELWEDCEDPIYLDNWYKNVPLAVFQKYLNHSYDIHIGQKDTSVGLHYDSYHDTAWVAVISGRKQVVLLSPDQEKYLYDGQVDCFNPDLEKFPLYSNAKPVECIINKGEILYIPPDWWHHFKNLEDTISLAINTMNEWSYELIRQGFLERNPIKGHLFPLIVKFPFLGKALLAVGLL
ncbi:MAG: cupin-like domain-containing protein [Brasilonema octagenarum HA4186-MV1]|jgi:lysine-specific demethylase 8|nr:cupin-like domain-containing protein [Brasilonema octagenarum HA4186-MV1]